MISKASDWIKLLVKFKGYCSECRKEIKPGEYALWSKSLKSIKHQICNSQQNNSNHQEISDQKSLSFKCYLCNKSEYLDQKKSITLMFDMNPRSIFICSTCINSSNSFKIYQHKFLNKLEKIAKLKSIS